MQRLEAKSSAELYTEIRKQAVSPDTISKIYVIQKKFETASRRLLEGLILDLRKYSVGSKKRLSVIKLFEDDFTKLCKDIEEAIKQLGIGCISIIHEKKPSKQKTFEDHFTSNTAIFFIINSILENQKAINQILAKDNVFVYSGADVLLSLCEQNDLSLAEKTKKCDDLLQKGRDEFKQKRLEMCNHSLSDVKHLLNNVFTKLNKKELKEDYLQEEYKQLSAFLEGEIKHSPLTKKQQKESDILTSLYYNVFQFDSCYMEKHLKISQIFDFVFKAKSAYDNYSKIDVEVNDKGPVYELLYHFASTMYEVAMHFTVLNESNTLNFFISLHWPDNEKDLIRIAKKYPSLMRFYYEFVAPEKGELNRSQRLQETLSNDLELPENIVKLISQYTIPGYLGFFKPNSKPLLSSASSNVGVVNELRPKAPGIS